MERRAVIFDLYQTLVRGGTSAQRRSLKRDIAHALRVDPDRFVDIFDMTYLDRMRGEFGGLEATMRTLAGRVGGDPGESQVRLAVLMWQRFHKTILWPAHGTLSTLDAVRERGYLLGLMSNCSEETPIQWPFQPMAQRFDTAVFSSDIGVIKPDIAIYQAVLSKLGVEARGCVYVGDGNDQELRVAASLGMRAIRTTEFADSDPRWTGETIAKLSELTGRLARNPTSEPGAPPDPRAA